MTSEHPTPHPEGGAAGLLGAARIRELAERHGVRPTKQWGQNFVVDANTVRRIVRAGEVTAQDHVVEIGPGLGSLTLALLEAAGRVTAVEVDPVLAAALPGTVAEEAPGAVERLEVVHADAMTVTDLPGPPPTALVANLPYNISVPVVLHFLETFPTIERVLVMVQLEVAERLAAGPGSKTYGVPSVKAAWWTDVALAGRVSRSIFWPVPNVDSGLVRLVRRDPPTTAATREQVFAVVDAAFAQRRKTLRASLRSIAGSGEVAEAALLAAGVDPRTRGEQLDVLAFARITEELMARVTP
ncbi:16S rRNA (adenine(1518)-N(6)/adenine(1519)-N(6))-dimethyltransferase RsmA [Janibacter sp. CX7]|jgi:16S rRNA (adenine1518-N6/adenine1519-N6)-dimethyltransferase|uniref:16S rRNA (adenine(1518)-N(6)/adenine(1519)-N(6))- dimethyltransferase RsmA n=1 Tax=Janibacter sp. CX7 TaxID=2963431 RepID=UPI0020CF972F|nr:16S rRNA (adenine(1518)-N(6)/adenine(1519)-N(6))-dimethyltransferase RsmA [Janibacter sp. CX7]UTT65511.1 16S rRNA (adenine(1518)-N(6)/adenine(1519)-N(6))-dimethyltransferase RsmA [Janibacter sp. CX7]